MWATNCPRVADDTAPARDSEGVAYLYALLLQEAGRCPLRCSLHEPAGRYSAVRVSILARTIDPPRHIRGTHSVQGNLNHVVEELINLTATEEVLLCL